MNEVWKALQPREKKMIYVLLVFLLLMDGWFFALKPSLETYTKSRSSLSQKQSQLLSLRSQLTQYQNAPSQLEVSKSTYQSLTKKYYGVLKNEKISQMITDQCRKVSLTPENLTISNTPQSSSSSSGSSSSSNNSTETSNSRLKTVYVNVTVDGTLTKVSRLFANVEGSMKHVGITNLSYTPNSTNASDSNSNSDSFTIQFAFYMIRK